MKLQQIIEELSPAQKLVDASGIGKAINHDTVVADADDFETLAVTIQQMGFQRDSNYTDGAMFIKGNEQIGISFDDAYTKMTIVIA